MFAAAGDRKRMMQVKEEAQCLQKQMRDKE
jgi:hypothetical protein